MDNFIERQLNQMAREIVEFRTNNSNLGNLIRTLEGLANAIGTKLSGSQQRELSKIIEEVNNLEVIYAVVCSRKESKFPFLPKGLWWWEKREVKNCIERIDEIILGMVKRDPDFWSMFEEIQKSIKGMNGAGLEVADLEVSASFSTPIKNANVWVVFKGTEQERIPSYKQSEAMSKFRSEASEQAVFCDELEKIIMTTVLNFGRDGLKFSVGFESFDRVKEVGSFAYFR